MDEGTLKTPIPNVVYTGHLCLGWCSSFVGSESGQKQSVKLLQNMVYNTTQHHPFPPPTATHCLYTVYCTFTLRRGGGGQRGATVYKCSSFVHGGNSSQAGSKIPTVSECISSL